MILYIIIIYYTFYINSATISCPQILHRRGPVLEVLQLHRAALLLCRPGIRARDQGHECQRVGLPAWGRRPAHVGGCHHWFSEPHYKRVWVNKGYNPVCYYYISFPGLTTPLSGMLPPGGCPVRWSLTESFPLQEHNNPWPGTSHNLTSKNIWLHFVTMFLFFHFNCILQTGMLWKQLAKKASSESNHFIFFCLLFCSCWDLWFFLVLALKTCVFQTASYIEWWDPTGTHNFRPELEQLFHMWDFCLYLILWALFTGLKGAGPVRKSDVRYFRAPIGG